MTAHSLTEAQSKLSELIDRALKGEDVVITRDGNPVARISGMPRLAAASPRRPVTKEAIDWLMANRVGGKIPNEDSGAFVSRMRDEEWAR